MKLDINMEIERCPVEVALEILGKKWTIHIIRDMLRGSTRFSEFLKIKADDNSRISTKMLSIRLQELEASHLIEKKVISTTPLLIEYRLTEKGKNLSPVIIDLAIFAIRNYPEKVFSEVPYSFDSAIAEAKRRFSLANF